MTRVVEHPPSDESVLAVLTDDEAVALALRTGKVWPAVLPTVDMEEERQIAGAGFRGVRSLIARHLLVGEHDVIATPLQTLCDAVFTSGPLLALYPASADMRIVYRDWASVSFESPPSSWIVDSTSSRGIHVFEMAPSAECQWRAVTTLTAAFEGDEVATPLFGGDTERCIVATGRPSELGTRSISVRHGDARLCLTLRGETTVQGTLDVAALAEALREIAAAG